MSQDRPDLDNSVEAAKKIIKMLSQQKFTNEIYINGSRSPFSRRKNRENSDWDFIVIVDNNIKFFPSLRDVYKFHGDCIFITKDKLKHYPKACEIFPNDVEGILKNASKEMLP